MGQYTESLQALGLWFERQKRVLPWRTEPTPYRVWISEIMLQQTQVVTVVPYFDRFMERFPRLQVLAESPLEAVIEAWAGLGYYSRARNLHRAAQQIWVERQGQFPKTREEWLEIPGVGPYTAGAILSISQDLPEAILDGNVERVLSRIRRVNRAQGDASFKARLWRLSRAFVRDGARVGVRPSVLNQAMMELGATVCTPRHPQCGVCPLADLCRGIQRGDAESYPPRRTRKVWKEVMEEVLACFSGGAASEARVLLRQRALGEWRAGLWDFPESLPSAWLKEFEPRGSMESRHIVTNHRITRRTQVYVSASRETPLPDHGGLYRWVPVDEPGVAVGSAFRKSMSAIRNLAGINSDS